jgi:threonine synthase
MEYVSTRSAGRPLDFEAVTLTGLASDGGLFLPSSWPALEPTAIASLAGLSYAALAERIIQPFAGAALSPGQLAGVTERAYASFAHAAVTPLVQLDERHFMLELFHGPTLAFKDVALQLLGELFELFLARRARHLTIIGATSGDTGSAAIAAVAGRAHVDIIMLHPHGRISDVQRRQMTTVRSPNVHNIAIEGSFDDAQTLVKRMFADRDLSERLNLGAVNSINWARLAAQIVYYFAAALQLGAPHRKIAFAVPTGNFGNVFAGYAALCMGLGIEKLIVATNVNDVLHRALVSGEYKTGAVRATSAPSMDIQVSSNFERLMFEACDRDAEALARQMRDLEQTGSVHLSPLQRGRLQSLFASVRVDEPAMLDTMRWAHERCGQSIDPHTAIGLRAARELAGSIDPAVPIVTLGTAHPAKFRQTVERATSFRPALPPRVGDLFGRDERVKVLPAVYEAVRDHVLAVGQASV